MAPRLGGDNLPESNGVSDSFLWSATTLDCIREYPLILIELLFSVLRDRVLKRDLNGFKRVLCGKNGRKVVKTGKKRSALMSSCFSNRAETSGFCSVFVALVLNVPVKKVVARARRITRHSGQTQFRVQSSLFSSQGGSVRWDMFRATALSGKPTVAPDCSGGRSYWGPFETVFCQFPARDARPELH
ncbi:hypothetical protein Enr10x_20360 [Gimesia panareensis]|uniref:Uncharacterized protein n=1 Tax=Gimesia panareensis TaxID=2527978 RepID=A0A517Q536_9PLAN|nr:hypothetical protein Enr10x_20360 [Gimesia panareensis]